MYDANAFCSEILLNFEHRETEPGQISRHMDCRKLHGPLLTLQFHPQSEVLQVLH